MERVPTATSRISRSRCSTPISSASSASIVDGVCTNVFAVVVPSYFKSAYLRHPSLHHAPYIFDLFHRKVRIRRHTNILRLHVYDDE